MLYQIVLQKFNAKGKPVRITKQQEDLICEQAAVAETKNAIYQTPPVLEECFRSGIDQSQLILIVDCANMKDAKTFGNALLPNKHWTLFESVRADASLKAGQITKKVDLKEPKPQVEPFSQRESATLLAALRYWQQALDGEDGRTDAANARPLMPDHFTAVKPLNDGEIDALCERLNLGDESKAVAKSLDFDLTDVLELAQEALNDQQMSEHLGERTDLSADYLEELRVKLNKYMGYAESNSAEAVGEQRDFQCGAYTLTVEREHGYVAITARLADGRQSVVNNVNYFRGALLEEEETESSKFDDEWEFNSEAEAIRVYQSACKGLASKSVRALVVSALDEDRAQGEWSVPSTQNPSVSHGPDCAQRMNRASECTCFKSQQVAEELPPGVDSSADAQRIYAAIQAEEKEIDAAPEYGSVDVAEKVLDMMIAANEHWNEFQIDPNREGDDDILKALDQAALLHRESLLVLLNCAEADLIGGLPDEGLLNGLGIGDESNPARQTIRELHALIQKLDSAHECSVDQA